MENYTKKIPNNGNYTPMSRGACDIIKTVKAGSNIVAIASSTGGPHALHSVIPELPSNLDAAVLLVQHMPKGFTKSLAERMDELSGLKVKEAEDGEELQKGTVYIAKGGVHMKVQHSGFGRYSIRYTDEPMRDGVKPNANYMYESLAGAEFGRVVCVVLTGMGADGTEVSFHQLVIFIGYGVKIAVLALAAAERHVNINAEGGFVLFICQKGHGIASKVMSLRGSPKG